MGNGAVAFFGLESTTTTYYGTLSVSATRHKKMTAIRVTDRDLAGHTVKINSLVHPMLWFLLEPWDSVWDKVRTRFVLIGA